MKASKLPQNPTRRRFTPKPLSVEQESAIDLLLTGKSDREVGEAVGVHRSTVQSWRTQHPFFMATLAQRREELFAGAVDRLRSLLGKALDNISGAIEEGQVRASFELLKATGLHGFLPPQGEMDPQKILDEITMRLLAKERLPGGMDDLLLKLNHSSPEKLQREREIRDELYDAYGEPDAS